MNLNITIFIKNLIFINFIKIKNLIKFNIIYELIKQVHPKKSGFHPKKSGLDFIFYFFYFFYYFNILYHLILL